MAKRRITPLRVLFPIHQSRSSCIEGLPQLTGSIGLELNGLSLRSHADLVIDCMKDHRYSYLDCGSDPTLHCLKDRAPLCMSYFRAFRDPSCYESTWYVKLVSFFNKQRR